MNLFCVAPCCNKKPFIFHYVCKEISKNNQLSTEKSNHFSTYEMVVLRNSRKSASVVFASDEESCFSFTFVFSFWLSFSECLQNQVEFYDSCLVSFKFLHCIFKNGQDVIAEEQVYFNNICIFLIHLVCIRRKLQCSSILPGTSFPRLIKYNFRAIQLCLERIQ